MEFVVICLFALLALGVVAALVSALTKGSTDAPVVEAENCGSCSSMASGECKIGCLMQEKKKLDAKP